MILFIDGSDINHLTLGRASIIGNQWSLLSSKLIETRPEGYLAAIDAFLANEEIDSIIAITGPGSATSLRTSLAIVNSLALAKSIKLYGVLADAIGGVSPQGEDRPAPRQITEPNNTLLPLYHHDPVITVSTRDALLRSL
jgi:tRNA A37 threonylcarbamoyladenosine modification protein TsaB